MRVDTRPCIFIKVGMELLLTPVVNRVLSKLIKKVGDGSSPMRASLSGGSVLLHNLELNLDRFGTESLHVRASMAVSAKRISNAAYFQDRMPLPF